MREVQESNYEGDDQDKENLWDLLATSPCRSGRIGKTVNMENNE